jgi:hypothetical protein
VSRAYTAALLVALSLGLCACEPQPLQVESQTFTVGESSSTVTHVRGPFGQVQTCITRVSGGSASMECH